MSPSDAYREALARRRKLQDQARGMGISEELISDLVDAFYAKVRRHPDLGPIFAARVGEDWGPHLAKMKQFWGAVTLRTGDFKGKPVQTHQRITEARAEHFTTWLSLWRETLDEVCPTPEAADLLEERALHMARRLQSAMGLVR